jgi:hypothetical protein
MRLDPADEVQVRGVALVDDRGAGGAARVDEDVDLVAAQGGHPPERVGDRQVGGRTLLGLLLAGLEEVREVLGDAPPYGVEIGRDSGKSLVLREQVVEQVLHDQPGDLLVELAQAGRELPLPARRLQGHLLQLFLQRVHLVPETLLLLLGQLLELLGRQDLAVPQRGEAEPGGRAQQGDAPGARPLLQLLEALLLSLLELLLQRAAPRRVLLALEGGREAGAQLGDEPLHVTLQLHALAGRQAEGTRARGLLEVVDVTPVVGRRPVRGALLDDALDHRVLAGAARAQGEDVVALALDGDAQLDGGDGPLLADELDAVVEVVGRGEVDVGERAGRGERLGRERADDGHVEVLSMGAARGRRRSADAAIVPPGRRRGAGRHAAGAPGGPSRERG